MMGADCWLLCRRHSSLSAMILGSTRWCLWALVADDLHYGIPGVCMTVELRNRRDRFIELFHFASMWDTQLRKAKSCIPNL